MGHDILIIGICQVLWDTQYHICFAYRSILQISNFASNCFKNLNFKFANRSYRIIITQVENEK